MNNQVSESSSYKRNLHFESFSPQKKRKEDNLFEDEHFFSSPESKQYQSPYYSNLVPRDTSSSQSPACISVNSPESIGKILRAKLQSTTFDKNFLNASDSDPADESSQCQPLQIHQLKNELFELLIVGLISSFNPSLTNEEQLIQTNKGFSIFNRVLRNENTDSILITGVSSTGKSASIDWALKQNKNYGRIIVDCFDSDSQVSFICKLNEAFRSFFQIKTPVDVDYDQFSKKSLFAMTEPFIQKSSKKALLVIQNADLLIGFTIHKVIYNLSELSIKNRKNIKIVLITKNPRFVKSLDRRQRSRFKLVPLEMLKIRTPIFEIFNLRLDCFERQFLTQKKDLFKKLSKHHAEELEQVAKNWIRKIRQVFCHNQSLKKEFQTMSKGIENHLNAVCWILAHVIQVQKVQQSDEYLLKQEVAYSYTNFLNESNSLPSKNLLKNSNLDQKIFMALMYTMLANDRKPFSFKTVLRISYEIKAEKIETCYNIYMSENNLKKAFIKLLDKKIICFDEYSQCEKRDRQMRVSMNFLDIKDAIINEEATEDLPLFVKQILSF